MNRLTLLVVLTSLAAAPSAYAQTDRNAAYFEVGGSAIVPSINYERRMSERWFGRAGLSFVVGETTEDTETTYIVPLTVSWISHPSGSHHFEAGGGVTIAAGDRQDLYEAADDDERFSTVFVTGIIGYRYQKPSGGFQFRSFVAPVASGNDFLPWGGISFGYVW